MNVGELIDQARQMIHGSLTDPLTVLDDPYTPGDSSLSLRYPLSGVGPNSTLSAGLSTFHVWSVTQNGLSAKVMPSPDGSPDQAIPDGTVIRVKPKVTTWALFQEWNRQLAALSSPFNGLYAFGTFGAPPDYQNGTYELPTTAPWAGTTPIRLVAARYRQFGMDAWTNLDWATYQPDEAVIRVPGPQPAADTIQFILAVPFGQATSLDDDPATLGLTENTWDIPGIGVAMATTRNFEGRRAQPDAQGDPRRAQEVQAGANIGVSRDWATYYRQRCSEEAARLNTLYPRRMPIGGIL